MEEAATSPSVLRAICSSRLIFDFPSTTDRVSANSRRTDGSSSFRMSSQTSSAIFESSFARRDHWSPASTSRGRPLCKISPMVATSTAPRLARSQKARTETRSDSESSHDRSSSSVTVTVPSDNKRKAVSRCQPFDDANISVIVSPFQVFGIRWRLGLGT